MTKTITRLFDSPPEALAAIHDLREAGVEPEAISLVANNHDEWANAELEGVDVGPSLDAGKGETRHGVDTGMTVGGVLGGWLGALAGAGFLAIPGVGAAVAAGWLLSAATGAVAGAAFGGAAGGLMGALKEHGVTDEDAEVFVEGVRRGGALVSVRLEGAAGPAIESILERHGGVDATVRGQIYREAGWTGFDPEAHAYSPEDIQRERERQRQERARNIEEPRSFAGSGLGGEASNEELARGAPASPPNQPGRDI